MEKKLITKLEIINKEIYVKDYKFLIIINYL